MADGGWRLRAHLRKGRGASPAQDGTRHADMALGKFSITRSMVYLIVANPGQLPGQQHSPFPSRYRKLVTIGISSRHNYLGSIRGKGIECPRTLANLRLPQHLAPPSKAALLLLADRNPNHQLRCAIITAGCAISPLALVLNETTPRLAACPSWRDNARRHDRRWAHIGPSDVAILEFVAD